MTHEEPLIGQAGVQRFHEVFRDVLYALPSPVAPGLDYDKFVEEQVKYDEYVEELVNYWLPDIVHAANRAAEKLQNFVRDTEGLIEETRENIAFVRSLDLDWIFDRAVSFHRALVQTEVNRKGRVKTTAPLFHLQGFGGQDPYNRKQQYYYAVCEHNQSAKYSEDRSFSSYRQRVECGLTWPGNPEKYEGKLALAPVVQDTVDRLKAEADQAERYLTETNLAGLRSLHWRGLTAMKYYHAALVDPSPYLSDNLRLYGYAHDPRINMWEMLF